MKRWIALLMFSLLLFPLTGCASAVKSGQNTALSGVDLVRMTDDMAKHKRMLVFNAIALVVIASTIVMGGMNLFGYPAQ